MMTVVAVMALLLGICGGAYRLNPSSLLSSEGMDLHVLWNIRLPRVLLAILVGASLSVGGASLQAVVRNPLADPALLGISTGGALGAALALVLMDGEHTWLPQRMAPYVIHLMAFTGALAATLLCVRMATRDGVTGSAQLVLCGVALNALCAALLGILIYTANDAQLRSITFWTTGSLAAASWGTLGSGAWVLVLGVMALLLLAHPLDVLLLGDREAGHLGIPSSRTKRKAVLWMALCVGVSVSLCGSVAFLGLVVPHAARLLLGPAHRTLLPACALCGAALLILADLVCRTALAPAELPVGLLTSLLGAPLFMALLLGRTGTGRLT